MPIKSNSGPGVEPATDIGLDEIEAIAKAAQPGPYFKRGYDEVCTQDGFIVAKNCLDAQFISLCTPQRILRWIALERAAQKQT